MGENLELEEGEMKPNTNESFDPDVDLSYIDKKVQNVLGHLRDNTERGGLDQFGPRFCEFGSFLSGDEHSPAVQSCQRSSVKNHTIQRSSNSLPRKNVVKKFQSVPTTACRLRIHQDPQNHETLGSLLIQAPENVPKEEGNAKVSDSDFSDQKPVRVVIKMGSELLSKKVAMVCNDVGLEDSQNLPPCDDNSRMLPTSLDSTSKSPSRILREMTAIPIPDNQLMSPLPDTLRHVTDKEKQDNSLDNEPVVKVEKKPSNLLQKKLTNVLDYAKTPSGRKRKAVDCFDANETPSIGEIKKKKLFSTGQVVRENATFGLGGATCPKDGNSQKGMNTNGESNSRVAFAKSNAVKVAGKQAEKEKKASPTKLKPNINKNHFGDKMLSKKPCKNDAYIGQNSTDIGIDVASAPSSVGHGLDDWVQCDSCETWRLLPVGLNPKQLPNVWLCSMQTWLRGMNHCGVSEEATTEAIKSLHVTQTHNRETGVKLESDASNANKSYQPLTSGSLSNPIKKKCTVKDLAMSHDFVEDKIDQKVKCPSAGTGSQIQIKKRKEGDRLKCEGSKKIKTGDGNEFSGDIKPKLEWTSEERNIKGHDSDFNSLDVKRDAEKKLLASKRKVDQKPQLTAASGSMGTKAHAKISSPVRKKRLMGNNSKLFADGEQKECRNENETTTKVSTQDIKARQRNGTRQVDGSQEHRNPDTLCKYLSGGSGQISGLATSSSSKVVESHTSGRKYVAEKKTSPVESVSSSRARSSCPKNLASAGESISEKTRTFSDAGSRIINNRTALHLNAGNEKQLQPQVCQQNSKLGDLSKETVTENRSGIQKFSGVTHESIDRSCRDANDILREADKLRKLADCFKTSGFDQEYKEANFKAARMFLFGASLLEIRSTENVERGKKIHVEAYQIAAKLSKICAHQYETNQQMAAAALAYKCIEVACMRIVYTSSCGMHEKMNELQKKLQTTPQGESPSSSASDIESYNHQGVIDKSAKTQKGLPHVAGNLLPVARSQQNFVPLLDLTDAMLQAMEASAKSQDAFRAATVKETQHSDCISTIEKVVNFSFHDVEALINLIELAMDALNSSRFRDSKS